MDLEDEVVLNLIEEIEEVENRLHVGIIHRQLRDVSNPFTLPDRNFVKIFRLDKDLTQSLITDMTPYYPEAQRTTRIPISIQILASLQFLGQGNYQRCVGQNFNLGLSQPSVSRYLTLFCTIINNYFLHEWIKFPVTEEAKMEAKIGFMRLFNFPGVIGCIDCSHIAIHSPPAEDANYPALAFYNRKGFYSLNAQTICDYNLNIISVNARYPGSVHDAAIWSMSNIKEHLRQNFEAGDTSSWLLGDSGYALEPWLLTPIPNAVEGSSEYRYTKAHCSARNTIERTFGVLKSVFICLMKDRVLHYTPEKSAHIMYTCCVLHNMRRRRGLDLFVDGEEVIEEDRNDLPVPVRENELLHTARRIQQNLIRQHFN